MIVNATLLRIDTPLPATPAGVVPLAIGGALWIRCTLTDPTYTQRREAESLKLTIAASLIVLRSAYPGSFLTGSKVAVLQDGGSAVEYMIQTVATPTKEGGLSHSLLGLEKA